MPRKILIVEDNTQSRVGLEQLLQQQGYVVVTADSFHAGVQAFHAEQPDLLIADVRLGEYNGLQLLATATIPVPTIIVTGYPDPVLEAEARELGAEWVIKPIEPRALLDLVDQMAGQSREFHVRRWQRKPVVRELPAQVDHAPARIVDISYGGFRFEIEARAVQEAWPSRRVVFPDAALTVDIDVIWQSQSGEHTWLFGAAVVLPNQPAWRGLVDAVS
jgi:DNA-binding response OmpR family regulator